MLRSGAWSGSATFAIPGSVRAFSSEVCVKSSKRTAVGSTTTFRRFRKSIVARDDG